MSWAKVGMKAVCLSSNWYPQDGPEWEGSTPAKGQVVTIARIDVSVVNGSLFLTLEEFDRSVRFHIDKFRPLVTKTVEDDIALFKRIADKASISEQAE